MTETEINIEEYGIPPPAWSGYATGEEYQAAYDQWLAGFANWFQRKCAALDAQAEAEQAGSDHADQEEDGAGEEPFPAPEAPEPEEPEPEDRYAGEIYIDPAGNVWSAGGELLSGEVLLADAPPGEPSLDTALLLVDLLDALAGEGGVAEGVESVRQAFDRPLMTTSFRDYTVTEGLLLLLLLGAFAAACARILKEGFSWLG